MARKTPRQVRETLAEQRAIILEAKSPLTENEDLQLRDLARRQHELRRRQSDILNELPKMWVLDLSKIPDSLIPEQIRALRPQGERESSAAKRLNQSEVLKVIKCWELEGETRKLEAAHKEILEGQMKRIFPESVEVVARDYDSMRDHDFITVRIDLSCSSAVILEDIRRELLHRQANRKNKQTLKSGSIRGVIRGLPKEASDHDIARVVSSADYAAGGKRRRAILERVRYHRARL